MKNEIQPMDNTSFVRGLFGRAMVFLCALCTSLLISVLLFFITTRSTLSFLFFFFVFLWSKFTKLSFHLYTLLHLKDNIVNSHNHNTKRKCDYKWADLVCQKYHSYPTHTILNTSSKLSNEKSQFIFRLYFQALIFSRYILHISFKYFYWFL